MKSHKPGESSLTPTPIFLRNSTTKCIWDCTLSLSRSRRRLIVLFACAWIEPDVTSTTTRHQTRDVTIRKTTKRQTSRRPPSGNWPLVPTLIYLCYTTRRISFLQRDKVIHPSVCSCHSGVSTTHSGRHPAKTTKNNGALRAKGNTLLSPSI